MIPSGGQSPQEEYAKAVEPVLKRLQDDYLDLYRVHNCGGITTVEEVMRRDWNDLVRRGKVST